MSTTRKLGWGSIIAFVMVFVLSGCGPFNDNRGWGDAPIGQRADQPWQVEQAPDDYPNVATRCSSFVDGKRIWIKTHNKTDFPPVITDDPNCRADRAVWIDVKPGDTGQGDSGNG